MTDKPVDERCPGCKKTVVYSDHIKIIGTKEPIKVECIKCPDEYGCGWVTFVRQPVIRLRGTAHEPRTLS